MPLPLVGSISPPGLEDKETLPKGCVSPACVQFRLRGQEGIIGSPCRLIVARKNERVFTAEQTYIYKRTRIFNYMYVQAARTPTPEFKV